MYIFEGIQLCKYLFDFSNWIVNGAELFLAQGFRDNDRMLVELIKDVRTVDGHLLHVYNWDC